MTMPPKDDDLHAWAALAPVVRPEWFVHDSLLHGVRHTQRVHIHVRRLARALSWDDADAEFALQAALWHDIGRTDDGWDPGHGEDSVTRARKKQLLDVLSPADAALVVFAIRLHCLPDELGKDEARRLAEQERALRILWLLKDADGLDRVRLGDWEALDPAQLRHRQAVGMISFARQFLKAVTDPSPTG
jgi:HD superfamily phosphodiesterase